MKPDSNIFNTAPRKSFNRYSALFFTILSTFFSTAAPCADPESVYHLNSEFENAYSYSIAVKSGDFLYIGGVTAVDEQGNEVYADDPKKQMALIYKRIGKILAAHGATAKNVVEETIYYGIDNDKYFETLEVRSDFYKGVAGPSASGVRVSAFTSNNILIEIKAVAYLGK